MRDGTSVKYFLVAAVFAATVSLQTASAHGLGIELAQEAGPYTVELEFDALELQVNELLPVSLSLRATQQDTYETFESVFFRIQNAEGDTEFAATLAPDEFVSGRTRASFSVDGAGAYEALARFRGKEGTLAEATFSFDVQDNASEQADGMPTPWLTSTLLGFVLGGAVTFVVLRLRHHNRRK